MVTVIAQIWSVFKLRISLAIVLCTLAGYAVTPGGALTSFELTIIALTVLAASGSAGALNQYWERDIDAKMSRTKNRPFVTGAYRAGLPWLAGIMGLLVLAIAAAAWISNSYVAVHILLGAATYGVIYTIWLKRRTWWNVVIGGLAGTFAVLAGAAAVDPNIAPAPLILSVVLFLWTPPHFWSLAAALREDYAKAGVPMLPVVVGDRVAAWVILGHTVTLVLLSLVVALFGPGWIYLAGAAIGGIYFVEKSIAMVRDPGPKTARKNFLASLLQLSLLLSAAIADRLILG